MARPKKFIKKFAAIAAAVGIVAPITALSASCVKTQEQKEVVFATAQGDLWPLMRAMKQLITEWNTNHKNDKDFMPVKLNTETQTKTFSELELVNNTVKALNDNSAETPNILLDNQTGAFIMKSRNKLLDLQKMGLKVNFNEKLAKAHSILAGQSLDNKNVLYNLPFDVCDTDLLVFNLDIMHKLFKLIMDNGGTVDTSMELYTKAQAASETGSSIPENSAFAALKAKTENHFSNMHVTADTFKSYKGIRDFVKAIYDNTEFDTTKFNKDTKSASLLSIDYQQDVFLKELYAKGNDAANSTLWSLVKTDDPNQPTKIDYASLLNSDSVVDQNFKSLWNEWQGAISQTKLRDSYQEESGNNKLIPAARFRSIEFKTNAPAEWGSFDIKNYTSAISYAASVGQNYTQQSKWSTGYFLPNEKNPKETPTYKAWATHDDVFSMPQVDQYELNGKKVYWEGGSSIVGVKGKSAELDKATVAFLNWLYNGQTNDKPNWKIIALASGYIVPAKNVVTEETLASLTTDRDNYFATWRNNNQQIKAIKVANTTLTEEQQKQIADLENEADLALMQGNNLNSAVLSLTSLLKFVDNDNVFQASYVGDAETAKLVNKLKDNLMKINTITNNGTFEWNGDGTQSLEQLQDIVKTN